MSDAQQNPFSSPMSAVESRPTDAPGQPTGSRPVSPMVFGVLGIMVAVFGGLGGVIGLIAAAVMQAAGTPQPGMPTSPLGIAYVWVAGIAGLVASVLLLAAGISLVRYRSQGPKLFSVYAYMSIVLTVAGVIYSMVRMSTMIDQMAAQNPEIANDPTTRSIMQASMYVGAATNVVWLLFPGLGLVLLNRKKVKDHLT